MDRNKKNRPSVGSCAVALRKESVDRNLPAVGSLTTRGGSLSARRAWIEIRRGARESIGTLSRSPQGERG